jgi:hypothetical protein
MDDTGKVLRGTIEKMYYAGPKFSARRSRSAWIGASRFTSAAFGRRRGNSSGRTSNVARGLSINATLGEAMSELVGRAAKRRRLE